MRPTPACSQRQSAAPSHIAAGVHQRRPPSLSTDQVPANVVGYSTTRTARAVAQGVKQAASTTSTPTRWPVSQQTLAHSLGGCQAGPPPPLLARAPPRAAHWRAIQMWPAAWPGTGAPYSGARSPSMIPPLLARTPRQAALRATQMQTTTRSRTGTPHRGARSTSTVAPPPSHPRSSRPPLGAAVSQPAPGMPTGRQSSGYAATPLTHPTRVSHTRRSAAHRRAIQNATAVWPWTGTPHWGARPPPSRAGTPQRCTAARRRRGLAAPRHIHSQPPSGNPTTLFFKHRSSHRDHHHHHPHTEHTACHHWTCQVTKTG